MNRIAVRSQLLCACVAATLLATPSASPARQPDGASFPAGWATSTEVVFGYYFCVSLDGLTLTEQEARAEDYSSISGCGINKNKSDGDSCDTPGCSVSAGAVWPYFDDGKFELPVWSVDRWRTFHTKCGQMARISPRRRAHRMSMYTQLQAITTFGRMRRILYLFARSVFAGTALRHSRSCSMWMRRRRTSPSAGNFARGFRLSSGGRPSFAGRGPGAVLDRSPARRRSATTSPTGDRLSESE